MFTRENTLLLVIDMQTRLVPHIHDSDRLIHNAVVLMECCKILKIPIMVTEQYPEGIGPTSAALKKTLGNHQPISKRTFSCCREPQFSKALEKSQKKQILIAGIETHVCVFQTAADLIQKGCAVQVAADAVGSRTMTNKTTGLERMKALGVDITSVESAVFELLETSAGPEFKQVLHFIK